jgi:hypothetical protein
MRMKPAGLELDWGNFAGGAEPRCENDGADSWLDALKRVEPEVDGGQG